MSVYQSLSDLEEQLLEVRAARRAILKAPLRHSTGGTSYDNSENLKALEREEQRLISQIRAEKRRLGLVLPAVREVY